MPPASSLASMPAGAARAAPPRLGGRRMPRVLLVHGEAIVRETLPSYLQAHMWVDIRTAASGRDALARLTSEGFDVVIADDAMQDMTGAELMRRVRAEQPGIGRIVMRRRHEPTDPEAAARAAPDAVVLKPYSLRGVESALQDVLMRPRVVNLGRSP